MPASERHRCFSAGEVLERAALSNGNRNEDDDEQTPDQLREIHVSGRLTS